MSSIQSVSFKTMKRREARKRRKRNKQILKEFRLKKMIEESLVNEVPTSSQVSTSRVETKGTSYSQNWKDLRQRLGLPSEQRRSPVAAKPLSHHKKVGGESSYSVGDVAGPSSASVRPHPSTHITGNCLSLDCEMVGGGMRGEINMLARCSIVDCRGNVVYDTYVAPFARVWDYRTCFSGIRPRNLVGAPSFSSVKSQVADLLRGKILVGHDLKHDLQALSLTHPQRDIRDTFFYKPFRELFGGRPPSLRKLAKKLLDIDIQMGEHSSIEDAQATMKLYQLNKKDWDRKK